MEPILIEGTVKMAAMLGIHVLLLLILPLICCADVKPSYIIDGKMCYKCPPGHRIRSDCELDGTYADCVECEGGYFQNNFTRSFECIECKFCEAVDNAYTKTNCSTTKDADCGCRDNFTMSMRDEFHRFDCIPLSTGKEEGPSTDVPVGKPSTEAPDTTRKTGLNGDAVAGIVVGCIAAVILVLVAAYIVIYRRKMKRKQKKQYEVEFTRASSNTTGDPEAGPGEAAALVNGSATNGGSRTDRPINSGSDEVEATGAEVPVQSSDLLSDYSLRHAVGGKLGNEWTEVVSYLGLQQNDIDRLRNDRPYNLKEQATSALIEWRDNNKSKGKETLVKELLDALKHAEYNSLVESLTEKFQISADTNI